MVSPKSQRGQPYGNPTAPIQQRRVRPAWECPVRVRSTIPGRRRQSWEDCGDLLAQHCVNDIETGAFELADDTIAATDRHHERVPDAQPWVIRIGHRTVHKSLGIKIIRSDRL
jgi:hypothetical protein